MGSNEARYNLVESLYGPGTVLAWLLTTVSVLISWTFNKRCRQEDTISVDFIAMILFPMVAACHLFFQVSRLPVTFANVVTSEDATLLQLTAAIEAPLNICETFSMAALIFAVFCSGWEGGPPKWKRLGLVVVVGLLSWATENVLYVMATLRGVRISDSTLSRPYLFFFTPIVAGTWAFLLTSVVGCAAVWSIISILRRMNDQGNREFSGQLRGKFQRDAPNSESSYWVRSSDPLPDSVKLLQQMELEARRTADEAWVARLSSLTTLVFLPCAFLSSLIGTNLYATKIESQETLSGNATEKTTQPFFLPKSKESILNLDQALALSTGFVVLLFSVWSARRSRKVLDDRKDVTVGRRKSI